MHSVCLVVGDRIAEQLEPFADYRNAQPYKVFVEADELAEMADQYGLAATDLTALAQKMPLWQKAEGGIDGGRLFYWSTSNPESKFDWYTVGGAYDGYLRLKTPLRPTWWQRLIGRRATDRVNSALKRQVDANALLADPPAVFVVNGQWSEGPMMADRARLTEWKQRFGRLFDSLPDDATLTVVDLHS